MKYSIGKSLDRLRRTLDVFSRVGRGNTSSLDTGMCSPGEDEGSVERQAELRFALQELRDLVLEGISLEMPLRTGADGNREMEPFLAELNAVCVNGYQMESALSDLS